MPQGNLYNGKKCWNFYETDFESLAVGSKKRLFIKPRGRVGKPDKVLESF